ncbi:chemotaxis protein CheV [Sulfurimonas autotrophica]|uniref:Response regulator receiver modulated CheW protein n=1 Tax=Sulfurimonas autotrophica (strain ATCC BAA-671 / DSM 16294 / JCM 11897 / OK10) TaxID=563040 RepID=E0US02_SULAO|nr:chemotaxis protein CheW [Sulfurimonas autotrophica]ADN09025.1 response regulator receiver modulated CheW protein [Sulfurimonas autotrophica DSM 16294]
MEDYKENIENSVEDDDELDLVALVSSNANDTSQYLVFKGSDNQYYAKNVSKIEELLVYKDIDIARTHDANLIIGTADIRGNMTTIINFDKWFGNEVLPDEEYELIIVAHYGGHRLGIVVKSVEYIVNIPADTMTDNSQNDEKTSFITKVQIGQKKEMCIIFDSDKMLLDTFETIDTKAAEETNRLHKLQNDKLVIFADDSRFIRKMAQSLFIKMGLKYKMYENGQLLLDDLPNIAPEDIGLFITDLEMPVLGGKEVIDYIRSHKEYNNINLIIHTNMSNDNMGDNLKQNGAQQIIGKVNMLALSEAIEKLMV